MNSNLLKYQPQLIRLAKENNIPYIVICTIALNESGCNPDVQPYREKTWRYFTTPQGKALSLHGTLSFVQDEAFHLLGAQEFEFQVHAHGAFQTVGSVLRELGFRDDVFPNELYAQGTFAMKHLSNMRNRFIGLYKDTPTDDQLYAMYNGGFGAVNQTIIEDYVMDYVEKAHENEKQTV